MNFLEKLSFLMKRNGENISTLSKNSGIPYTTIDGFYKKGYSNTKLSTLTALCDYYHVTLDYLVKDQIIDPNYGLDTDLCGKREPVITKLLSVCSTLNDVAIDKVIDYASDLASTGLYRVESTNKPDPAASQSIYDDAGEMLAHIKSNGTTNEKDEDVKGSA